MSTVAKVAVGVVGGLLLMAGCSACFSDGGGGVAEESEAATTAQGTAIEVLSAETRTGDLTSSIVGQARNTTDRTLSYAQVTFRLYDDAGNAVGTAVANVSNLDPRQTWTFEATIIDDSATRWELVSAYGVD